LLTPGGPFLAVYIFAALVGLGVGGIYVMIYAIFPDIPDVDELRTGERREGIFGAMITLFRKFSSAIGIFLVSNLLAITGYVQPAERVIDGVRTLVDQPQSDQFTLFLRLTFALVPIIFVLIALFFAARYPLTGTIHERLNKLLAARRAGEPETEEMAAEALQLEEILI
jgi:Na+/melibiose symporter-like transporter